MSDSQIFLLIGLAYTVMGIGGLFNKDSYKHLIEGFAGSPALLFVTGLFALVTGFVIVAFHNVWAMGWTVLITIFGWMSLIKGMMILMFPGFYTRLCNRMTKSVRLLRVYAGLVLVIGIFLLLLGLGVL